MTSVEAAGETFEGKILAFAVYRTFQSLVAEGFQSKTCRRSR